MLGVEHLQVGDEDHHLDHARGLEVLTQCARRPAVPRSSRPRATVAPARAVRGSRSADGDRGRRREAPRAALPRRRLAAPASAAHSARRIGRVGRRVKSDVVRGQGRASRAPPIARFPGWVQAHAVQRSASPAGRRSRSPCVDARAATRAPAVTAARRNGAAAARRGEPPRAHRAGSPRAGCGRCARSSCARPGPEAARLNAHPRVDGYGSERSALAPSRRRPSRHDAQARVAVRAQRVEA